MRGLVIIVAAIGGIVFDVIAFDGRYSGALWQAAKYQGAQLNYEVKRWLSYLGPGTGR